MRQIFMFKSQIAYTMLTDPNTINLQSSTNQLTSQSFKEMFNRVRVLFQQYKEQQSSRAVRRDWMLYRISQSSLGTKNGIFSKEKRSKYFSFDVIPPANADFHSVHLLGVRAFVQPIGRPAATLVDMELTRGSFSYFSTPEAKRRYAHLPKDFSFRYIASSCFEVGSQHRTDYSINYSPFGPWKLNVEALRRSLGSSVDLNLVDEIVLEFDVTYMKHSEGEKLEKATTFPSAPRCIHGNRQDGNCALSPDVLCRSTNFVSSSSQSDLSQSIMEADRNKDGGLSLPELQAWMPHVDGNLLSTLLMKHDTDANNIIDFSEVVLLLWDVSVRSGPNNPLSENSSDIGTVMAEKDNNDDGFLDLSEVRLWLGSSVDESAFGKSDVDSNGLLDSGEVITLVWEHRRNDDKKVKAANDGMLNATNDDDVTDESSGLDLYVLLVSVIGFVLFILLILNLGLQAKLLKKNQAYSNPSVKERVKTTSMELASLESTGNSNPLFDKKSKSVSKTKKSGKPQWEKRYSVEHEATYFVNTEDGRSAWEIPEGAEECD